MKRFSISRWIPRAVIAQLLWSFNTNFRFQCMTDVVLHTTPGMFLGPCGPWVLGAVLSRVKLPDREADHASHPCPPILHCILRSVQWFCSDYTTCGVSNDNICRSGYEPRQMALNRTISECPQVGPPVSGLRFESCTSWLRSRSDNHWATLCEETYRLEVSRFHLLLIHLS